MRVSASSALGTIEPDPTRTNWYRPRPARRMIQQLPDGAVSAMSFGSALVVDVLC